jgi:hypothetical protein
VSEELQKRAVDNGADHAKVQLDRLAAAVQLGAEAIAAGDISAINPYLKALDRLDRYRRQPAPTLSTTTKRARSCSPRSTASPPTLASTMRGRRDDPSAAEGQTADLAGPSEITAEASALEAPTSEAETGCGFFT